MKCQTGEGRYDLYVPPTYAPSPFNHMPVEQWMERIITMQEETDLGLVDFEEMKKRVILSLHRMPDLLPGQRACVSFSGGKDSQAIFMLAVMKYGRDRVFALFADTHDEWPETMKAIAEFQQWIQVPIYTCDSGGIHYHLREVRKCWPQPQKRHCTKDSKMVPQRDWLDKNGFGQDRKRGEPSFRNINVTGTMAYTVKEPTPLLLSGERWYESKNRSKLEFDERVTELLRWTHRPVLDWKIENIWDFILAMRAPINPVYLLGVQRAACAGCIFANVNELALLGRMYPDRLLEWVVTEAAIGVPRPYGKQSLKEIYENIHGAPHENEHLQLTFI